MKTDLAPQSKSVYLWNVTFLYLALSPAVTPAQPATQPVPVAPLSEAPIATTIAPSSPALPQPSPNLANNAAFPDRRGYIRAEPLFIYPWVGLGFGYNDNLTGTSSNRISSPLWVISPKIQAEAKSGAHTHILSYLGNYGRYSSSPADNYDDHELSFTSKNQFTARANLDVALFYLDKIDPRGNLARPLSDSPDEWRGYGGSAVFGYGARSAQGRIELEAGFSDKSYRNNRAVTELFDVNSSFVAGRFFYRIAPRTRVLFEVRDTVFNYKSSDSQLDNSEIRYLVGLTWDLAAATSGTVKLGYMTKDFRNPLLQDYSGPNLDAILRWSPRTYSYVDFLIRRSAVDSAGTGIFTVDTAFGGLWQHRWQQQLSTRVTAVATNSDFRGISRQDKLSLISFGGYFDIRSWLRFGAELSHQRRSSTDNNANFSRNVLLFTIAATL